MMMIAAIFQILFGQYSPEEVKLYNNANTYRQKHGIGKLELSDSLSLIAKNHCINLNKYHSIFSGVSMHNWYDEGKKRWIYVNANDITHGHDNSDCNSKCCLESWIESKPHRQTLKSKTFTQMGVAIYKNYAIILFN